MNQRLMLSVFAAIVAIAGAGVASAECFVGGDIAAESGSYPGYPNWKYTATITWDTGTQYALSHLDILLDAAGGTCSCSDLGDALEYGGLVGTSLGDPMGCEVQYDPFLECSGDPSIPGVEGILLKLEPTTDGCEPGTTGSLTFTFYSQYGPAAIDEEILVLFDKYGQLSCSGNLSGQFPALTCDPVANESVRWDALKGLFR